MWSDTTINHKHSWDWLCNFIHHSESVFKQVLCPYLGDGETRDGLPAGDTAETSLVLDDAVRDSHLAAQGGEEEHQLKCQVHIKV